MDKDEVPNNIETPEKIIKAASIVTESVMDSTKIETEKASEENNQSEINQLEKGSLQSFQSDNGPEIDDYDPATDLNKYGDKVLGSKRFFYTELMSTAGPRKNFQENAREGDIDLGEDVVGCFVRKNVANFWLLDGTSDCPIFSTTDNKEIISSRVLSQDVAWHIQQIVWKNSSKISSETILKESFEEIQIYWQDKLDNLSENDKSRLLSVISDKNRLIISTTVIFGTLNINGKLDISRIGDSYIVTNPVNDQPEVKGRLFLVIKGNSEGTKIEVELNSFEDTRCQSFTQENIRTVLIASDGLSVNTVKWLQLKPPNFIDPQFRKTLSAIKHGTCDDKALCVIQILSDD